MSKIKQMLKKILPESFILFYHKLQAQFACLINGFPAKKMTIIGVTGTNGKTTVVNLIGSILQTAGYKTAQISTINFRIGEKVWPNPTKMTTISAFQLQKFLKQALRADCQYAVIETTSHALVQNRVWGIPYDVAVLTNVTHEHLDYHQNMTKYRQAKGLLFKNLVCFSRKPGVNKTMVVNEDDPAFDYFWQFPADIKFAYKIGGNQKNQDELVARKVFFDISGSRFEVNTPYGTCEVFSPLPGRFNISNTLAAIAVGLSQNIDLKYIRQGIERVKLVPGRMEKIEQGQNFEVIVDYAHTPDALKKIYQTTKPLVRGKIIAVLGAAGDRDRVKRPIMGAIVSQWADLVIITNEDPYHEDPEEIIEQVAAGVPKGKKDIQLRAGKDYFKILDRRAAIRQAFSRADRNDLVVITGKGAEQWMVVGDEKIPWDERKIVRELLKEHLAKK